MIQELFLLCGFCELNIQRLIGNLLLRLGRNALSVSFHSHSSAKVICFTDLLEFLANLEEVICLCFLLSFFFYFLLFAFLVKNHSIQGSVTAEMHMMPWKRRAKAKNHAEKPLLEKLTQDLKSFTSYVKGNHLACKKFHSKTARKETVDTIILLTS